MRLVENRQFEFKGKTTMPNSLRAYEPIDSVLTSVSSASIWLPIFITWHGSTCRHWTTLNFFLLKLPEETSEENMLVNQKIIACS